MTWREEFIFFMRAFSRRRRRKRESCQVGRVINSSVRSADRADARKEAGLGGLSIPGGLD
jgi:hypothetical protein